MSAILMKFTETVNANQNIHYGQHVDLSEIIAICDNATPAACLKLSKESDSSRHLAESIVRNLCKYAPHQKYPLFGLRAIQYIISRDVSSKDAMVQQILMLHCTKMIIDPETLSKAMEKFDRITCDIRMDVQVEAWINIAKLTIENHHVRDVIDTFIGETFGNHLASRIFDTKHLKIDVVFFDSVLKNIRGFSGFNVIYINKRHFEKKLGKVSGNQDLIFLDVATVAIHEASHVRVRQVFDDLNASTPLLITGSNNLDPEFGRMVERKFFGFSVDWKESNADGNVPVEFVKDFLHAIRNNLNVPEVPVKSKLYPRSSPVTFHAGGGADITFGNLFD